MQRARPPRSSRRARCAGQRQPTTHRPPRSRMRASARHSTAPRVVIADRRTLARRGWRAGVAGMFHVKRRPSGGEESARRTRHRNGPGHATDHNTLRDARVHGRNEEVPTARTIAGCSPTSDLDDTVSPDRLIEATSAPGDWGIHEPRARFHVEHRGSAPTAPCRCATLGIATRGAGHPTRSVLHDDSTHAQVPVCPMRGRSTISCRIVRSLCFSSSTGRPPPCSVARPTTSATASPPGRSPGRLDGRSRPP